MADPNQGFTNRIYTPGEAPPAAVRQTEQKTQYFYIRTGIIDSVDLDKYRMAVIWNTKKGGTRDDIPLSFPYFGPAGVMGGIPEKGCVGVFGFIDDGDNTTSPILITYLPSGLSSGLNFETVKILPNVLSTKDINRIQFKHRKMALEDLVMASCGGASIFLNTNVELKDSIQDSILIREEDQAIIATSLNNFIFADGVSMNMGPATRNRLPTLDNEGNKLDNNGSAGSGPYGKDNIYIVPHGKNIDYTTQYYTEYRVDVDEFGNGKLDLNDVNSSSPLSDRKPLITLSMGNFIGSDRRDDQKYGELLKVSLFRDSNDKKGSFTLGRATQNNGVDEPSVLGLVYALHSPKTQAFLGLDKEGHYYMNLPASSMNPLGAGRSMSILAQGNLKEIWGPTADTGNSWDLVTKGGVKWDIGNHNSKGGRSRSIDIKTTKGITINVGGPGDDGYAKVEKLQGNVSESIVGNKTEACTNLTVQVNGAKSESISGNSNETVGAEKFLQVTGNFNETIIKEKQSRIGSRKTTITGNDELTVIRGNITETITTFGKKSTSIATGSIEQSIGIGNYTTSVKAGSYKVNVNGGNIEIKTDLGLVTISGPIVTIKGSLVANIDAPLVRIGKNAPIGGVVTGLPGIPSHMDFCTGLPLLGSFTVSAAR